MTERLAFSSISFLRVFGVAVVFWLGVLLAAFAGNAVAQGEVGDESGASETQVDVLIYSTQTSGLAAARELALGAPHLRVALVSCGNLLESPLAQGLCVEDARNIGKVSGGFYGEWRQAVVRYYQALGKSAFASGGRFVYEPEVAARILWSYLSPRNAPNLVFYSARLLAASDEPGRCYADLLLENGTRLRLVTRYFIDASVEADLARMLGAEYRIGRGEDTYNDRQGNIPPYPSAKNGYITAPQRLSALLTLKLYKGAAPRVADLTHPSCDPASYAKVTLPTSTVSSFRDSWSMTVAKLPNGKRELNEGWSDWPDVGLAYQWIFAPHNRGEIRQRVIAWTINRVRYLQEHGYPNLGIATIPQKLYVREGPRIVGLDTYTRSDIRNGVVRHPVAVGCYCEYDRHDAFYPNHIETTRFVFVPMGALLAADHPNLVVSTAVSTDCQAYSSAVRVEHTRANMGAAAAAIVMVAAEANVGACEVSYEAVRAKLISRGYSLLGW
ncbi:MAG: FAD-dependent oxidoreductase [Thermoleophilia bacterium]|nr:FAD-dependent oxidoreductase [Thermoleophilia bacterium]